MAMGILLLAAAGIIVIKVKDNKLSDHICSYLHHIKLFVKIEMCQKARGRKVKQIVESKAL